MGFFKNLFHKKDIKEEKKFCKKNVYDSLGKIRPFTTLNNNQLKYFLELLSQSEKIDENQKEAFLKISNMIYQNSNENSDIWNLQDGNNMIYKNEDIEIHYDKKSEDMDELNNGGRINIIYKSSYGSFIINQNGRNKIFFLLYISEYISAKLLDVLKEVENQVLEVRKDNGLGKYRIYVGKIEGKRDC